MATAIRDADRRKPADTMLRILRGAIAAGASDVHFRANHPPMVRMQGQMRPLDHPVLSAGFTELVRDSLAAFAEVPPARLTRKQGDFSCVVPNAGRFRVHFYRQNASWAIVLRTIPDPVPDFAALRVPPVVKRIATLERGLVLVTGATGNGKSTTIASLLTMVNSELPRHVITIEDPIEYLFEDKRATFSQREIGRDVDNFRSGLVGALREDPDWIFVGEIRTAEEFDVALSAAEAGHVVLSTLHSQDTARAVQRMIQFMPDGQQETARQRIADVLAGVIAQRLVYRRGVNERILVTEVLMRSPTVQDCIRDASRFRGLHAALEAGTSEYGTHTFDQQLGYMVRDGLITVDTARAAATNANDLMRGLKMAGRFGR